MKKSHNSFQIMIIIGILVLPTALIPLVNAQAGQVTLNPTDDAYTDANNVHTNYGSETTLKASAMLYWTWLKL